jgi:signal transduction histidine kinase
MVSSLSNIGLIYYQLSDFDKAEENYTRALDMAKGYASCKPEIPTLYKNLSQVYEHKNKDKALEMYKLYADAKDSLFTSDLNNRFAELETKYETLEKEKKIALLNKDNSIQALEIRNQQLLIKQKLFELTQSKLDLSEANLEITNNELEIQRQNEHILIQRLDSTEKVKSIQDLSKKTQIQQLELANRNLQLTRRNVAIGSLVFVLLLTALLGYSYYRRKQLKHEARMQAALLKQQALATKAVMEAEEAERQRIAKDLHDGVGQMMSAAKMNLSAYEASLSFSNEEEKQNFDRIISLVDESCREVRSVSHNMMPNALLKNSLASAVREFIDKLDHKRLKVHLYTQGLDDRLDSNMETVLYRVIQECVNNVIKHSGADTMDISIVKEANEITATIEDNGKGFAITDTEKFEGMGLKNIRTRVEYLKGTVDIDSALGRGTLVALHVPLA